MSETMFAQPLPNNGGARSQFVKSVRKAVANYRAGISATEGMERVDEALLALLRQTRGHD